MVYVMVVMAGTIPIIFSYSHEFSGVTDRFLELSQKPLQPI